MQSLMGMVPRFKSPIRSRLSVNTCWDSIPQYSQILPSFMPNFHRLQSGLLILIYLISIWRQQVHHPGDHTSTQGKGPQSHIWYFQVGVHPLSPLCPYTPSKLFRNHYIVSIDNIQPITVDGTGDELICNLQIREEDQSSKSCHTSSWEILRLELWEQSCTSRQHNRALIQAHCGLQGYVHNTQDYLRCFGQTPSSDLD